MQKYILSLLLLSGVVGLFAQAELPPVYPYAENGKWGVIDKEGKILVKPKYQKISLYTREDQANAIASVTNDQGLQGAINRKGKLVAKIKYQFVDLDGKGDFLIVRNPEGLYGLVKTKNKKEILKTEYKSIGRFQGEKMGVSVIRKGEWYGAINEAGKLIAEPVYQSIKVRDAYGEFPNLRLTREDGSAIAIDCFGEPVKKGAPGHAYDDDDLIFDDLMVEESPAEANPPQTTFKKIKVGDKEAFEFMTTYAGRPNKTVLDTISGFDEVVEVYRNYTSARGYGVDIVMGKKDGKFGIVHHSGEVLTPFEYDVIREKGGRSYFELQKGDLFGVAARSGKRLFDATFSRVKFLNFNGVFLVQTGPFEGYADRTGHIYLPGE
ncbi:MAG: WG repeat-containing protein [Saprospiraceae bacterium]|nr:WG repeat-containing protein [Saprospiraceae bacterium]MCB9326785.1 WG repeat-containing protein [Lewinellaceae bacterium]